MTSPKFIIFYSHQCEHSKSFFKLMAQSEQLYTKVSKINVRQSKIKIPSYIKSTPTFIVKQVNTKPQIYEGDLAFRMLDIILKNFQGNNPQPQQQQQQRQTQQSGIKTKDGYSQLGSGTYTEEGVAYNDPSMFGSNWSDTFSLLTDDISHGKDSAGSSIQHCFTSLSDIGATLDPKKQQNNNWKGLNQNNTQYNRGEPVAHPRNTGQGMGTAPNMGRLPSMNTQMDSNKDFDIKMKQYMEQRDTEIPQAPNRQG